MCGIVGYIGNKNGVPVVLEGLSRLEYRGYDSAGISYKEDHELNVLKKEGKLENLEAIVNEKKVTSSSVIGHTRWATHGEVNDTNAHPHGNDDFSVVHNGIIENAFELKKELQAEGEVFHSQTDSEVFLVLLTKNFKSGLSVKDAVLKTFKALEGNSSFVVLPKAENNIYAIKRSAPLVCGKSDDDQELLASSDPYALIGFVDNIFFPGEETLCFLDSSNNRIDFFDLDGNPSENYKSDKSRKDLKVETKEGFDHFMLKEIYEQPKLINEIAKIYKSEYSDQISIKAQDLDTINIIGCGTAWHAGLCLRNIYETELQTKVNVELASEFRYREPFVSSKDLGLFISQSGETADTIACTELCEKLNLKLASILNVGGSTLNRLCHENFMIHAGQEIGVASTKAFTMQVIVGHFLMRLLQGKHPTADFEKELEVLKNRIQNILDDVSSIKKIANEVHTCKGYIFTGRNKYFPIALEGALKLKEIAYVHAEGYAAGELKHGPIALIDEEMVSICLVGPELFEKTLSNIEEIKARKGKILIVGPKDNSKLEEISDWYIPLDFSDLNYFSPIYVNVVMQLLSYYIAREKGTDIDKPRNLAKSVTVE